MTNAQCHAIANAMQAKGLTDAALAAQTGLSEQRVSAVLAGSAKPTQQEFSSIARVLGLSSAPQHAAQVVA